VAIKDKQPTRADYPPVCMLNKVLQPLNSNLICRLAVVANSDSLVARDTLLILGGQVVLASKDNKRRDSLASSVNSLDYCYLLAITRLDSL
jgi:hypothetical protein